MLNSFRRFVRSRAGAVVAFVVLGLIALAFAATDITGLTPGGGGVARNDVAEVGGQGIGAAELRQVAQSEVEAVRTRQPTFDVQQYLAAGGLDQTLERLIGSLALFRFGEEQGMAVSKRSIDGEIASIPALRGPTGQFDQTLYESLLRERGLTDAQIRQDIARDLMARRLLAPTQGASQVSQQLALPYAALLLERRQGQIGFIPNSAAPAGPAPTPAEVQAFYQRNIPRYTVPERRVVRYAVVTPGQVAARAQPTDAEIQQAYNADRARYAPTERRTITQVVVADQAGANALAARVRGGTSVADAARAAGLAATTQEELDRNAYVGIAGQAAAQAAFSAQEGAVIGPVRGPIGFIVARVDDVVQVPGRTLEQVRSEIVAALTQRKTADALAETQQAIDDALNDNATFDEIVTDRRLQPTTTPPLLASGINPEAPAQPDPALGPVVQTAFQVEADDPPQLVPTGADGGFALVDVGQVVPAAPRPLAQIRDQVARDLVADRARQATRRIAAQVVAAAGRGGTLAQALSASGVNVPAPRPVDVTRAQVAARARGAEPGQVLLFSMAPGTAKLLQAPDGSGYYVVKLDRSVPGDARANAGLVRDVRADLGRQIGREYAEQFVRAARAAVGVEIDRDAVTRVRSDLAGNNAQ
ncbi:peptidylprolyl isomerase [Sphingomonas lenta]|uniref:Parvulin-like PPIase n=1 Tax=Sphingomonas lenta TaxID=1141887 RepID=A0A2A2SJE4_9SPHN|nr:peptidylprolyl isomerase [Sphingomonas lenta]PAX09349.1 peptidylprolyl isomerase [Sphingomonas lenta]